MGNLKVGFNWKGKDIIFDNLTKEQADILIEMINALVETTVRKSTQLLHD